MTPLVWLALVLETLLAVSEELGRSPAQVALRWALDQPAITSVIAGARTAEHLGDNLKAGGWRLDSQAKSRLDEVSNLPDRYPESMEKNMHERRNDAVG